jgi:hypothetical protein
MTSQEDRERFRRIIEKSKLPIAIFGEWVMGVDRTTAQRYLHNGEIPASRRIWLRSIESVTHHSDGQVHVSLKWSPPNRRWWPYVEKQPRTYMTEERGLKKEDTDRRRR